MRRAAYRLLLLLSAVTVDGGITAFGHAGAATIGDSAAGSTVVSEPVDDYRDPAIGIGDSLEIYVLAAEIGGALSGNYRVGRDGSVALPVIGPMSVVGLSSAEVSAQVRKMLADDYLGYRHHHRHHQRVCPCLCYG